MTEQPVMVVDLVALRYSTVQARDVMHVTMDCLDEAVFRYSKVYVVTRHAITGHYINHDAMAAMYRVIVGTRHPMVAIPQVMACEIHCAEADY